MKWVGSWSISQSCGSGSATKCHGSPPNTDFYIFTCSGTWFWRRCSPPEPPWPGTSWWTRGGRTITRHSTRWAHNYIVQDKWISARSRSMPSAVFWHPGHLSYSDQCDIIIKLSRKFVVCFKWLKASFLTTFNIGRLCQHSFNEINREEETPGRPKGIRIDKKICSNTFFFLYQQSLFCSLFAYC